MLSFTGISKYKKIFCDIFNEKLGLFLLKLSSFILTIALARILGPKGYGIYTVALSIAFLLSGLLDLGIPVAIVRYLPNIENKEEKEALFNFLLKIQVIVNLLFLIILFFLAGKFAELFFKNIKYQVFAFASIFLAFLITIRRTISAVFQSYKRFDIIRNLNSVEGLLKLVFIIFLALLFGTLGSVLGFSVSYIILILISILYLRKIGFEIKDATNIKINKTELFKYLFLVNLSTLSRSAYGWIDSVIISTLLNFQSVGFYRVANALVGTLLGFAGLHGVFAPRISKWDLNTIKKNLPKIMLLNLLTGIFVITLLFLLGKIVIVILYGPAYLPAFNLLKILSLLLILNAFSYFTLIFDLKGKPEYTALTILVMTISNAVLDYVLILKMGLAGAVWATVISWAISLIFAGILFKMKL